MPDDRDREGQPEFRHFRPENADAPKEDTLESNRPDEHADPDEKPGHEAAGESVRTDAESKLEGPSETEPTNAPGPIEAESDSKPHAPTADVPKGESDASPKETKPWKRKLNALKKLVKPIALVVAIYVGLGIAFGIVAMAGMAVDYGGPVSRFGISALTSLAIFAPVFIIAAIVIGLLVWDTETSEFKKLSGSAKAIIGGCAAALLVASTLSLSSSPLTCMHTKRTAATCTEPEKCAECGEVLGDALGHDWEDATCTAPRTCRRCGTTQGTPTGHIPGAWTVVEPATCSQEGSETTTCIVCGEPMTQSIPMTEHTPGDWVTVQEPSVSFDTGKRVDIPGKQEQYCTVCGAVVGSQEIQPTEEQAKEAFKASCSEFSYDQAARDPDSLNGSHSTFSGRVVQVMQQDNLYILRVNKDNDYDCTVYVVYLAKEGAPRILEDDNITLWGTLSGLETYTTIFGASVTIPSFTALYVE